MITFMSDSGELDHYVAAVKARVYTLNPEVNIVDISHHIKAFDIAHGAFVLKAAFPYFPAGTVHIVAVNTQHRKRMKYIVAELEGHFFLAPDNGIIALLSEEKPTRLFQLPDTEVDGGSTFPELEILASAAANLSSGMAIEELGTPLDAVTEVIGRQVKITENRVVGNIAHVDHFGNLITNISKDLFEATRAERDFEVSFGREKADRIHNSYFDLEEGDCVLFFNSMNYLEIAINKGRAAQLLGLRYDSPVIITFK